jgi:molybdopterin adenylyltransferase
VTDALVITVSDGVSAGIRADSSGDAVEKALVRSGFKVDRTVVADDREEIAAAIGEAQGSYRLVVTTGGTGFGPRDVTPEATMAVLDREAPGLTHLMLARGLESTPMAALSRARAGSVGRMLVINLPGSPKGAEESLEAILAVVPHALELLAGETGHDSP